MWGVLAKEINQGLSAKVDEIIVKLTGDDLKQRRNSFKFSEMHPILARMMSSGNSYM